MSLWMWIGVGATVWFVLSVVIAVLTGAIIHRRDNPTGFQETLAGLDLRVDRTGRLLVDAQRDSAKA